jgi:hypothetical protein
MSMIKYKGIKNTFEWLKLCFCNFCFLINCQSVCYLLMVKEMSGVDSK